MNVHSPLLAFLLATALCVCATPLRADSESEGNTPHIPSATRNPPAVNKNITAASSVDSVEIVSQKVATLLAKVRTVQATLVVSKWDAKNSKRRYFDGVAELARDQGARATLVRKKDSDEYVVNGNEIWAVDYKAKEAQRIPTSIPLIGGSVSDALILNMGAAIDWSAASVQGEEKVDGVACWVIDAQTPSKFSMVGLDPVKIRLWISKTDGIVRVISIPKEKDLFVELKNVRLNDAIDSGKFEYKPNKRMKVKSLFNL